MTVFFLIWVAGFASVVALHKYYLPRWLEMTEKQLGFSPRPIAMFIALFVAWPVFAIYLIFADIEF